MIIFNIGHISISLSLFESNLFAGTFESIEIIVLYLANAMASTSLGYSALKIQARFSALRLVKQLAKPPI